MADCQIASESGNCVDYPSGGDRMPQLIRPFQREDIPAPRRKGQLSGTLAAAVNAELIFGR
jgi:hypothetical protein